MAGRRSARNRTDSSSTRGARRASQRAVRDVPRPRRRDPAAGVRAVADGQPVAKNERAAIKDFEDLRIDIADNGVGLRARAAEVEITGPSGGARISRSRFRRRAMASCGCGLSETLAPGSTRSRSRRRSPRATSARSRSRSRSRGRRRPQPGIAPGDDARSRPSRASTPPSPHPRERDDPREGRGAHRHPVPPVRDPPDRNAPVKFFMSQTEVTNEQFLRFVDALRQTRRIQIPRELRFWSDLAPVKKNVEDMSFALRRTSGAIPACR